MEDTMSTRGTRWEGPSRSATLAAHDVADVGDDLRFWPTTAEHVAKLRASHQQAAADLTVVRAAIEMDRQGLLSPWEARQRVAFAHDRLEAAVAAASEAAAAEPLLRADLRSAATRVMRAEERASEAGIFSRRARERDVELARKAAGAQSPLVLPASGAAAGEWHQWVEDSVFIGSVSVANQMDEAKQDVEQSRNAEAASASWWASRVPADVAANMEVQDGLANLSYAGPGDGVSNASEVYQRELVAASAREKREGSALAEAMKDLSIATTAGAVLASGAAVGAGAAIGAGVAASAGSAMFGPDGGRTLAEVMGTPLEGLGARVDAIVGGPLTDSSLRPLDVLAPVHALTA